MVCPFDIAYGQVLIAQSVCHSALSVNFNQESKDYGGFLT
jgi:hypothetical protein